MIKTAFKVPYFKVPKFEEVLFWIPFGLYIFFGVLSTSFYFIYFTGTPYIALRYLCIGILAIREILTQKYNKDSLFLGVIFALLVFLTTAQSGIATVAFVLIYVFCARDIDFNKIAKFSIWVTSIAVAFVIFSCYVGIIQNYDYSTATRTRYCLGFRYPLYAPSFLFNITGCFLYVRKQKVSWVELLILVLINYWMFIQTNSRLSFYLSLAMIVIFGFLKIRPNFFKRKKLLCWLMVLSFAIGFLVSYYFTVNYDGSSEWQSLLNSLLGGRLQLGQTSLKESGVSWFGQEIELNGNGLDVYGKINTNPYNYVDSFYIQILQRYGIVFTFVWIAFLTFAMGSFYKNKDYNLLICMTFIALHCVIDDTSLALYYNTFWLAGAAFMRSYKPRANKINFKQHYVKSF